MNNLEQAAVTALEALAEDELQRARKAFFAERFTAFAIAKSREERINLALYLVKQVSTEESRPMPTPAPGQNTVFTY